jgi:8-oxo-dGTP pyrophosphatase MutT (NUDIX family)
MTGTNRKGYDREEIAANLRRFERLAGGAQAAAAVAVVVMRAHGGHCVPVFQRTHTLSRHAGQMALPGGRVHDGETVAECAIREAEEELGLRLRPEDMLGALDDFDTRSGFTITPLVFWSEAGAPALKLSPAEVFRVFLLDLDVLVDTAAAAGGGTSFSLRFPEFEMFAPTAAILYQFTEVALGGRDCRVADFYQPPFTHR